MRSIARTLVSRLILLGVSDRDDERQRLSKATTNVISLIVTSLAPFWSAAYLMLDRPASAAIPGCYSMFSAASLVWTARTGRMPGSPAARMILIGTLPFALQWTLGGFEQGSMVALWAFAAPLLALVVYGARAGTIWFIIFVAAIVISGLFESTLRDAVGPLPIRIQTAFFVLNMAAPLSAVVLTLAYFVRQRDDANARTEDLLLHILPSSIVQRLKDGEAQIADRHEHATVLFADIVGFTAFADVTPPERIVDLLSRAFVVLDDLAARHGLEKIKTLGDGYLAVAGVTSPRSDHALAATAMALEVEPAFVRELAQDWPGIRMRVGLATGPVMAGVIGTERFSFDVWGDTVNTSSRMASLADPGSVQITEETCAAVRNRYRVERREAVEVKGKGLMTTYVVLEPLAD